MTASEDERRILRDAIVTLVQRDAFGNLSRLDRLGMALTDHEAGSCASEDGRECAAVAVARAVLGDAR